MNNYYFENPQKTGIQNNNCCSVVNQPTATKYTAKNLQAYYVQKNISFGRLTSEHLQHGAYVDKAKNVLFNFFTFPDVREVSVVIAREVEAAANAAKKTFEITTHELQRDTSEEAGIFRLKLGPEEAQAGDKYAFEITYSDGQKNLCPDPYAKRKSVYFLDPKKNEDGYLDPEKQYRTDKFAEVYDHNHFKWTDNAWIRGKDKRRISRLSNSKNGLKSFQEARMYKMNIATETKEGTFDAARDKLKQLLKEGKMFREDGQGTYNTIHLMPVETCNSPEWGYDGVYKAAPLEAYGGPNGLKRLVDFAHSKGINVAMDAVPNHFGTDYNLLREVGPYLGADVECGPGANFENDFKNNKHARDWVINICGLNWVRDYHIDILRLDLTQNMKSDYALRQFANEVHFHAKHVPIIDEDGRKIEVERLLTKIPNEELALGEPESVHAEIITKYDHNKVSLKQMGMDSRESYEYEHAINGACSLRTSMEELKREMIDAVKKGEVVYGARQSHDEKGKKSSLSQVVTLVQERLNMAPNVPDNFEWFPPQERAGYADIVHKAAIKVQALVEAIVSGERPESISLELYTKGIEALNYALAQDKISIGLTASLPAPHMRFQGKLEPFYFFRQLAIDPDIDNARMLAERGYLPDEAARKASIVGSIPYSNQYREIMRKVDKFEQDVNAFAASNKAMSKGCICEDSTVAHNGSNILGTHIKKDESEVFSVSNFSDFSYNGDYEIQFPQGKWQMVICSTDVKYAGSGKNIQTKLVKSDGINASKISIPANSFSLFKKIN